MSTFEAASEFISHCYRQGFLAGCEDYRDLWQAYCGGGEPYRWTLPRND